MAKVIDNSFPSNLLQIAYFLKVEALSKEWLENTEFQSNRENWKENTKPGGCFSFFAKRQGTQDGA
jgi:hypothetical protein